MHFINFCAAFDMEYGGTEEEREIEFEMMDEDVLSDDKLGNAKIDLSELGSERTEMDLELLDKKGKNAGTVKVALTYVSNEKNSEPEYVQQDTNTAEVINNSTDSSLNSQIPNGTSLEEPANTKHKQTSSTPEADSKHLSTDSSHITQKNTKQSNTVSSPSGDPSLNSTQHAQHTTRTSRASMLNTRKSRTGTHFSASPSLRRRSTKSSAKEKERLKKLETGWYNFVSPASENLLPDYNPILTTDCPIIDSKAFVKSIKKSLSKKDTNTYELLSERRKALTKRNERFNQDFAAEYTQPHTTASLTRTMDRRRQTQRSVAPE